MLKRSQKQNAALNTSPSLFIAYILGGVPNYYALDYSGRAGVLHKLTFALQCELENEVDWALNALLMLSADDKPGRYGALEFEVILRFEFAYAYWNINVFNGPCGLTHLGSLLSHTIGEENPHTLGVEWFLSFFASNFFSSRVS